MSNSREISLELCNYLRCLAVYPLGQRHEFGFEAENTQLSRPSMWTKVDCVEH